MSSRVSFRVENGVVKCFVIGERSLDEILNYWRQLVSICHQEKISLLQMNLAISGKFDPFEAIQAYQSIIEIVKSSGLKIAVIDVNQRSATGTQVGCNMGASQGVCVAYFCSNREATRWLLTDFNALSKSA